MLKIGIDLHGVIDSNVYKFKSFILACKDVGMTVYIISGPNVEFIKKELQDHKIVRGPHYDGVFSVVDHIQEKGCEMWYDEKGRPWASEEDWWCSKAEICEKLGIDIMIDDSEKYQPYFENIKTKFVLYRK